jgi:hypothetical protein
MLTICGLVGTLLLKLRYGSYTIAHVERRPLMLFDMYDQLNLMRFHIGVTSFYTAREGEKGVEEEALYYNTIAATTPFTVVESERHLLLLPFRFLAENSLAGRRSLMEWVRDEFFFFSSKHTYGHTHKKSDGRPRRNARNETKQKELVYNKNK